MSWAINVLLTFIEYNTFNSDTKDIPYIQQLDGTAETDIEPHLEIPRCLGNLDCQDENLYHIATILRGFEGVFSR